MKLRFDPLGVFRASTTPVGLYARQKWLNEEKHRSWKVDFQATADRLLAGQSPDGSWDNSVLMTIQRLFGLYLTVRYEDQHIMRALDWLIDRAWQWGKFDSHLRQLTQEAIASLERGSGDAETKTEQAIFAVKSKGVP